MSDGIDRGQLASLTMTLAEWDDVLRGVLAAAAVCRAQGQTEHCNRLTVLASNLRGQVMDAEGDQREQLTLDAAMDARNSRVDALLHAVARRAVPA